MSLSNSGFWGLNDITYDRNDEEIKINVPIRNMAEYQELINLAQQQTAELQETLHKLYDLDAIMKITF